MLRKMMLLPAKAILGAFILTTLFAGCKKEISKDFPTQSGLQYNPYGLKTFWDAGVTETGEILILGSDGKTARLIKTDKSGKLIWQKSIPSFNPEPTWAGHSLVTRKDGTIILIGSSIIHEFVEELEILKYSSAGEILKTTHFSIKQNNPGFTYPIYSTNPGGFYAPDNNGGFYFQAVLSTRLSFQVGWDYYIMHYNNRDSIDQHIDFGTYFGNMYELAPGNHGGINVLSYLPGKFTISQFNVADYLSGKITRIFQSDITQQGGGMTAISDNTHLYGLQLKPDPAQMLSEGLYISKTDLTTGTLTKDWLLPLNLDLSNQSYQSLSIPAADDSYVYFAVGLSDDVHFVKSSKEGQYMWTYHINGNLSRDYALKLLPVEHGLIIFGYGTYNRSRENNLFMLKLDHDGKVLSN